MQSISKCSACDRCRGQKLRCVRNSTARNAPCERCRKAGSECINTLYLQKRRIGSERDLGYGPPPQSRPQSAHLGHFPRSTTQPVTYDGGSMMLDDDFGSVDGSMQGGGNFSQRTSERMSLPNETSRHASGFSNEFSTSLLGPFDNSNIIPARGPIHLDTGNETFGLDAPIGRSGSSVPQSSRQAPYLGTTQPLPPMTSIQDCLNCLSELCSRLLKHSNQYDKDCKTLDQVLAVTGGNSLSPQDPKNAIGYVLESSQDFLNIVGTLKNLLSVSVSESGPVSPVTSDCSYSDLWEGGGDFLQENNNSFRDTEDLMTGISLPSHSNPSVESNDGLLLESNMSTRSREHSSTSLTSLTTTSCLDIPTTLMALTCYLRLLHMYDIVFSCISTSLEKDGSEKSNKVIPSIIPGLVLGGFNLDHRQDLQIEVMIHLSETMLERIESALGIDAKSMKHMTGTDDGILEAASVTALLDVMSKQQEGGSGDAMRVRRTIETIRKNWRGRRFVA